MLAKIFCFLLSSLLASQAQFVIDRGERDVFRNLTGCSKDTPDFCYYLHADKSDFDPCVCRCWPKYPMYRNPDVYPSGGGQFLSKGKPGCVWHSNHRYECFHIRKLGKGIDTSDDEQALEFDLSNPGSFLAYSDLDLSSCTGIETTVKMPEDSDFKPKPGLLSSVYKPQDVIRFLWLGSSERFDGGLLRGVFTGCAGAIKEAARCFVGKITGVYNGDCSVRALNGQCCILPFKYNGKVYNNCTRDGSEEAWCAVRFPFFGNETDWRQDCTNSTKVVPSSSPSVQDSTKVVPISSVQGSPTMNTLQTTLDHISVTKTLVSSTQIPKPANTLIGPIMGLTVVPQPDHSPSLLKESKTMFNLDTTGTKLLTQLSTQLLTKSEVSTTALKTTPTAHEISMSTQKISSTSHQMSTTIHSTSSIIDYKSSVSGYSPTMVIYPSSTVDYQSSTNYTSSVIDHAITPTSGFLTKSIDFTSSVSDSVSSVNVSIINYTSSIVDNASSIIGHVSSIIDHVSSITVPEQSNTGITHSFTTKHTSAFFTSTPSTTDHTSRMSDYMSSVSVYHTTVSDRKRIMSTTTNQHTLKSLFTGTMSISSQAVVSPSTTKMSSPLSSSISPDTEASSESDANDISVAIIIVIVMASVAFAVILLLAFIFLVLRHRKNRIKKYKVINKKAGNQTAQSPPTERPAPKDSIKTDVVTVEESGSDIAETEFTIPEKNEQEAQERPSGKYYGPSFMTFKL